MGIESKRFEPFRGRKTAVLYTYWREDKWGEGMAPWQALRDLLRAEPRAFRHLDAAQLVKHALGLVSEARRKGLDPVLVYLHVEPASVDAAAIARHREEVAQLVAMVAGAQVRFAAVRWRAWLENWTGEAGGHARAVLARYEP